MIRVLSASEIVVIVHPAPGLPATDILDTDANYPDLPAGSDGHRNQP